MPANERTPLVGNNNNLPSHNGGESEHGAPPNLVSSLWWIVTCSWINVFLVFVPLGIIAEHLHWPAIWIFSLNFLAIIPLAKILGDATEQVSLRLGQTLGGLLNATFGNAVELIVGIAALLQGQLRIVQTSLIGSILSNILLVLGMSFVAGGLKRSENTFQQTAAQASGSIMTLGCITLAIPAAYHMSVKTSAVLANDMAKLASLNAPIVHGQEDETGLLFISRGTSLILVGIYVLYLVFQLKTHAFLYEADEEDDEEEEAKMSPLAAMIALGGVTVLTAFNADYLVGAIDEVAREYSIPKAFIGTILLPIVGNMAEHLTAVWMASKGKMEISLGIAIGSSIQISVGMIPILCLVGWAVGQPLTLYFETFETVILVAAVFLVNTLVQDGKSNYMEGAMLCSLYAVAALSFWVSPAA
ncbi:Sodium/calcium exchanger membrane region [Kalmanozyma brasiliensis GHG001]|uniref:Vacuolar calcium ion transporter n=1 Tax=Kalmanozyma brasiliensis (strain GHG001) TaxID=1365824 RepID=V5ERY1_KALBG|nr:Sodium/calcium exchanger membrane region [Kalmanozyma brasiliensis GHG001]EST05688.1 Sodium/calcium exchanger membrane region [Kalmanozyma brasiliensis GHG001]